MKNILKIVGLVGFASFCFKGTAIAQNDKTHGIGISFGANDFYGPQTGQYFGDNVTSINYNILTQKNDTSVSNKLRWEPMVRITYWWKLKKNWDFNIGLNLGNATYPASINDSTYQEIKKTPVSKYKVLVAEADARANYNFWDKSKHYFTPYVFAGLSATLHPVYFGADLPLGLGLNINLDKKSKDFYLNLDAGYKVALTANDFNHVQYAAGFVYWFKPHYKAPKPPSVENAVAELAKPSDMDHDGVPDSLDKCPTIAGLPEFNGCPDTDGDGVPDDEDECPLVPGLKQFNGCPDSDHDGIPDNKDKCPYEAGPADNGGCPIADRDHDGVPDAEDKCPDVPGTIANHGCPEVKKEVREMAAQAAKDIFFDEGKATLKKNSYASLNKLVKIMNDDKSLYLDIAGYTDNLGNNDLNLTLSDKRANACRDYLVSKGISAERIAAKGYGKDSPIADNATEEGRAKNRRTELKLRNYK
jgi:outer membrane protein OmpA-like peptidoglycan-associated protein